MSRTTRRLASLTAVLLFPLVGIATPADAAPPLLPNSMAVIGDSISQAANTDWNHAGASFPGNSWSTGYESGDGITSHYERILKKNTGIRNRNFNDAESGSWSAHAPTQADRAVSQGVQYVTYLMGGNDVCASSIATMTSVAEYEGYFRTTMNKLTTGLPNANILVASIPDAYQLWQLFHDNWWASWVWSSFGICQSMLSTSNTEADRQFVRQRNIDLNDVLRTVCAQYTKCRYDGGALFNYRFQSADISGVDYFHPSLAGQANIARVTWAAGYWPTV